MAFQAYADKDCCTRETAREAAIDFFKTFPKRRKCNITEGVIDGNFFTVTSSIDRRARSFRDITKKMIDTLPTE